MASLLPPHDGILPYWLLLTSAASIFNTVACYLSKDIGARIYQGPTATTQVTALSTRLFGTWTLLSFVVRTYAAYNISSSEIYTIALSSYAIALAYFCSEWLVYKSMTMGKELAPSFVIATVSTIWMFAQRDYYTGF